jgi:glycosidase
MDYSKDEKINVRISKTAIKNNERVNVCLEIAEDMGFVNEVYIFISMQNNKNEKQIKFNYLWTENGFNYFTCNIELQETGLYYYGIKIIINETEKWLKSNRSFVTDLVGEPIKPWTLTVYDKDFSVPEWAKGTIIYQIFPDRFYQSEKYIPERIDYRTTRNWGEMPEWRIDLSAKYNNTDFFMGNLKGIEEKIPYLKELGVKILYLNPIFESQSNHRYDVGDYEKVDSYLGCNEDLKSLCTKAHMNGMKIVLDGVFNHTGNDSKYFNEYGNYKNIGAFQGTESKYYDWYKHTENGEFKYWWGFRNLPVCNGDNPDWQNYIYGKNGIIDKWFKLGIDGIRLDVVDELTDDFIDNIKIAIKRNKKDGFLIGEVWENAITKEKDGIQRKYLLGKGLDSVMNYPFTNAILKYVRFGDYRFFIDTVKQILTQYPEDSINSLMNSLSTHDITRAITTLVGKGIEEKNVLIWDTEHDREWQIQNEVLTDEEYQTGEKMFKIASAIQYFLPGNSCIYYGDEIGMYGYRDPFNRKCFEWNKIGNNLNEFFKDLGKIKNKNVFLKNAKFELVTANEQILAFKRFNKDNEILILVNRTPNDVVINSDIDIKNEHIILQEGLTMETLAGYGFVIIENNYNKK